MRRLDSDEFTLSEEARRIFGFPPAPTRVTLDDLKARIHPDDRPEWERQRQAIFAEGRRRVLTYRVCDDDNTVRWLRITATIVRGTEGSIALGSVEDVTERIRERAETERQRALLAEVARLAKVGFWRQRLDRETIEWSDETYRLLGLEPQSFTPTIGLLDELMSPNDVVMREQAVKRILTTGEPQIVDFRVRHADGRYRWIRTTAHGERDEEGFQWIVGLSQDITELVESEEFLRFQKAILHEAEAAFGLCIWSFSFADRSFSISATLARELGLTDDIECVPFDTVMARIHPEDRMHLEEVFDSVRQSRSHTTASYRVILPDGSLRVRTTTVSPRHDRRGTLVGLHGFSIDVTELAEARRRLEIAERLAAIGRLAGGIAHNLNNLLAVIALNLDLIRERNRNSDDAESLAAALRAVERGTELIKGLLVFAQRETSRPVPIRLAAMFEDIARLVRPIMEGRIILRTMLEHSDLRIMADPAQFETALMNLIVNARDAMPKGGIITLAARRASSDESPAGARTAAVAVSVRDTGTGMSPEVAERAIEPFFTTKRTVRSAGLGLAMVHGFVSRCGGSMRIDSKPGEGTTVTLILPEASDQDRPAPPAPSGNRPDAPLRDRRILVVDDEDEVRQAVARICARAGAATQLAANADDALARLASGEVFDLVLSDIRMPGALDGVQLADAIAERWPRLPVVLMSGYHDLLQEGSRRPILRKPFSRDEIISVLVAALGESPNAA